MANDTNTTRNVIVKDLELYWAKLNPKKPVEPFGEPQWEIQVRFPKKRVKEMEEYGKVKECPDGGFQMNFRKKALKKDGTDAMPIRVVDTKKHAIDPTIIGNGSTGNIMLMLRDWEQKGPKGNVIKSGCAVALTAVQVTDLKVYEGSKGTDFDYEDADSSEDEDGDIPF